MQFSENRLRQIVNPALATADLAHQLTMAGLEVDAITPVAPAFSGVVVGEVLSAEQHPNADKLRVTTVNIGAAEPLTIVCGAANVRAGLRVPVATVGAVLPGDFHIKAAKLRGVESAGMICAEQELGLESQAEGIWELPLDAPIGVNLRDYLKLDDNLIELGLTPNRGDCLSLRGLAREAAAVFGIDATLDGAVTVPASTDKTLSISVKAAEACPRYVGRVISGISTGISSPQWLAEALRRYGVRSLHPVVDVTNFVMLELGQPMHAFDASQLDGGISVRRAQAGEALTLLDGQTLTLREQSLVIADDSKALALAGIMGGQQSAVGDATTDLFLEAAFFAPLALAGEARRYGLHTDSSHRFERGVDFDLPRIAVERASELILAIVGGAAGPVVDVTAREHLPTRLAITLRRAQILRVLGFSLSDADVLSYLTRLGMQVSAVADGWQVIPPGHRFDIAIEVDLIEELARLYGYNRLPVTAPSVPMRLQATPEARQPLRRLKRALVDLDYQEAITFSFVEPGLLQQFDPGVVPLVLANPISSDLSAMRTSLWPGLALALRHNQSRQQTRIRLFESGLRFLPEATADAATVGTLAALKQEAMLAGIVAGTANPEAWNNTKNSLDFYDVKGNIESVLQLAGVAGRSRFVAAEHPALHPGQTAAIEIDGQRAGWLGALHPRTLTALDLIGPVFVFELRLSALAEGQLPAFTPLSRFPEVRRDLALVVPDAVTADDVLAIARQAAGDSLRGLQVFDVYRGKGLPDACYSLAIALTWQHPERTLQDAEVQTWTDQVVVDLQARVGAVLRG